jgi:hypothetical protein
MNLTGVANVKTYTYVKLIFNMEQVRNENFFFLRRPRIAQSV